jgi:hypothetical protein
MHFTTGISSVLCKQARLKIFKVNSRRVLLIAIVVTGLITSLAHFKKYHGGFIESIRFITTGY